MTEFNATKKRLVEEVRRSGGLFGTAELAALTSAEDGVDEETLIEQILKKATGGPGIGDDSSASTATGTATAAASAITSACLKSHVALPSPEEINSILLDEKKKALLGQFGI